MTQLTEKEIQLLKDWASFASVLNPTQKQLVIAEGLETKGFVAKSQGRVRVTAMGRAELDARHVHLTSQKTGL